MCCAVLCCAVLCYAVLRYAMLCWGLGGICSAFGTFFFRPEWGNYVRFFLLLRLLRLMSLMGLNKQFRVIFRTFFDSLPKFYNIFSSVLFFFCTQQPIPIPHHHFPFPPFPSLPLPLLHDACCCLTLVSLGIAWA